MQQQPTNELTAKIDVSGRPVRLAEFRRLCDDLMACLAHLAKRGGASGRTEFAISRLHGGSATVGIEPDERTHNGSSIAIYEFKKTAIAIREDSLNGHADVQTLELFRKLAMPVSRVEARMWLDEIEIDTQFIANIDKRLKRSIQSHGQLKGVLEKINVHGRNQFSIYPPILNSGINCVFSDELIDIVGKAIKRSVTVTGVMHYYAGDAFPYLVRAEQVTIHPADAELPTLKDLRGIAPDCTGNQSTIDYLGQLCNE